MVGTDRKWAVLLGMKPYGEKRDGTNPTFRFAFIVAPETLGIESFCPAPSAGAAAFAFYSG